MLLSVLKVAAYVPFAKLLACDEAVLDDADAEAADAVLDAAAEVALDDAATDEALDDAALELVPDEQPASTTVKVTNITIAIALKYLLIPVPPALIDRSKPHGQHSCTENDRLGNYGDHASSPYQDDTSKNAMPGFTAIGLLR